MTVTYLDGLERGAKLSALGKSIVFQLGRKSHFCCNRTQELIEHRSGVTEPPGE